MEAGDGDADDIFDLGEDDEDVGNPAEGPVAEVEEGDGDDDMKNDPYNPDDWDDALGITEAEEGTSALLFDEDNGQEDGRDASGSNEDDDDDDLDSLMDRGLEEIDNLLSTKGRQSVFCPPQASLEGDIVKTEDRRPSPAGGIDRSDKDTTVAAGSGKREQPAGDAGSSVLDPTRHPQCRSARGTGANAASALMSATAPTGSAHAAGSSPSLISPDPENLKLGGPASATAVRCNSAGVHHNGQAQSPCGGQEVTTRSKREGARSYVYEAGALHGSSGGGGVIADHLYSPPRRRCERERDAAPFIKAKGLTLTYAQAKLFGLAGSSAGPPPVVHIGVAKQGGLKPAAKWPGSGSKPQTTGGTRRSTDVGGGSAAREGSRRRQQQSNSRRVTNSLSRMEQLSNPRQGKGRPAGPQGEGGGGRNGEGADGKAPFTWKRSRRAEAAMRDPACGYDFVREAGYSREDFLARTEAYSSYSRQKLETRRGEDEYAARVEKLECPQCHNPQSYDEFVSKKLKCGGCDVAYCVPRAWNRRVWDQRNEMCMAKSVERKARIEREAEEEFLRSMPKQTRHAVLLRQRVGQKRRAREGGAASGISHHRRNQEEGAERDDVDREVKDASGRPASAPTSATTYTINGDDSRTVVARGMRTTGSQEGKKGGGSEGRRRAGGGERRRHGG
eukprot:g6068.t1